MTAGKASLRKPAKRAESGYNPTPEALKRISNLKKRTNVGKKKIRDVALEIGLTQIEENPALLVE